MLAFHIEMELTGVQLTDVQLTDVQLTDVQLTNLVPPEIMSLIFSFLDIDHRTEGILRQGRAPFPFPPKRIRKLKDWYINKHPALKIPRPIQTIVPTLVYLVINADKFYLLYAHESKKNVYISTRTDNSYGWNISVL